MAHQQATEIFHIPFKKYWIPSILQVLVFGLFFLTTGCSPLVKHDQPVITTDYLLDSTTSVGQTGVARYDGLAGISIYLQPVEPGEGNIQILLRTNPYETQNLAAASMPLNQVTHPGFYKFEFSPVSDSTSQDFFILVKVEGSGMVKVGAAPGNAYLNGALYFNKIPQNAQMAFSLLYNSPSAAAGLAKEGRSWLILLMGAVFLFIIPGWALLSALWPSWKSLDWIERLGLSAGASIPLYPILIVWTNLVGLQLGRLYAWILPVVACVYLIWKNFQNYSKNLSVRDGLKSGTRKIFNFQTLPWAEIATFIFLSLVILVRFWEVRSLDVPMWGDSYQHTVMAQLLVDHGGLFDSWQPYAESLTFSYHFGFHSLVAAFHWLTGLEMAKSTIWTGQMLNILAIISLAPLAIRLGRSRWAGVLAILLAGLLFQMPNFYTNWGRYTQLAGQVILVPAIWLIWSFFEEKLKIWPAIIGLWLIFAGLAMTHYRVTIMAGTFILAYWLLFARKENFRQLLSRTVLIISGSLVIFLPWFLRAFSSELVSWFNNMLTLRMPQAGNTASQAGEFGNLTVFLSAYFWIVFIFFIAWGLWRKEKGVALITVWWSITFLAANPAWLGFPGKDILNSFAVLIAIYIPASILIGAGITWGAQQAWALLSPQATNSAKQRTVPLWISITLILILTVTALVGSRKRLYDINFRQHALAARPDIRASAWIRQNTAEDASFLVNTMFAYDNTLVVGLDGGWWLPLLAGRRTSLPPLTYPIEKGPVEDYRTWVNQLPAEILAKGITHPEVLDLLEKRGYDYIYIGQQQGSVNSSGTFLDIDLLVADPRFNPVYHQDRVWIFQIQFDP